jgi:DNA gyrase/topoisomerase IV subunit A
LVTKTGQIKKISLEKLLNVTKSGKKVVNLQHKEKCQLHSQLFLEHRQADCCDSSSIESFVKCDKLRSLQQLIKNCADCQRPVIAEDNSIVKAALISGDEEISLIVKRSRREGRIDNVKQSLSLKTRLKNEQGEKIYCFNHQHLLRQHSTGHRCYLGCKDAKQIQQLIKNCADCHSEDLFTTRLKKQIKCLSVVDLLVKPKDIDPLLLLVKQNNSCEKRRLSSVKSFVTSDNRQKKTNSCEKH